MVHMDLRAVLWEEIILVPVFSKGSNYCYHWINYKNTIMCFPLRRFFLISTGRFVRTVVNVNETSFNMLSL